MPNVGHELNQRWQSHAKTIAHLDLCPLKKISRAGRKNSNVRSHSPHMHDFRLSVHNYRFYLFAGKNISNKFYRLDFIRQKYFPLTSGGLAPTFFHGDGPSFFRCLASETLCIHLWPATMCRLVSAYRKRRYINFELESRTPAATTRWRYRRLCAGAMVHAATTRRAA